MFDKDRFSDILKTINGTYGSQRNFAKKSGINRTYLSQYMNIKLDNPPKPDMLKKLATNSNGVTTYDELMEVCGYSKSSNNVNIREELYQEFEKEVMLHNFYAEELDIIKNYLLSDSSDSNYSNYFNQFEIMVNSLEPEKKQFLMDFCSNFVLLVSKNIIKTSGDSPEIFDKNIHILKSSSPKKHYSSCPVYTKIVAGQPNWAEGCLEGYLSIAPDLMGIDTPEECFFVRVSDESMNKLVNNGGYALIRKQDSVDNGEVALVVVNGNDATLKVYRKQNDLILLEPMSSLLSFSTQVYNKDSNIRILGKYLGKFEMNK